MACQSHDYLCYVPDSFNTNCLSIKHTFVLYVPYGTNTNGLSITSKFGLYVSDGINTNWNDIQIEIPKTQKTKIGIKGLILGCLTLMI